MDFWNTTQNRSRGFCFILPFGLIEKHMFSDIPQSSKEVEDCVENAIDCPDCNNDIDWHHVSVSEEKVNRPFENGEKVVYCCDNDSVHVDVLDMLKSESGFSDEKLDWEEHRWKDMNQKGSNSSLD